MVFKQNIEKERLSMFESKNRIEVIGEVRNFKIKETKKGKKFAIDEVSLY